MNTAPREDYKLKEPMLRLSLALSLALAFPLSAQEKEQPSALPAEGAFSHKKHSVLKLKCSYCHTGAETAERARFPQAADCRTCHTSMEDRVIPVKRIYQLPDFVFFSHAKHLTAKVECADCHGEVNEQDRLVVARPVTMQACMECHKQAKASLACNVCHELGQ